MQLPLSHTNNCDEKETQRTDENMFPPSQQHHIGEPKRLGRLPYVVSEKHGTENLTLINHERREKKHFIT